ncbi:MAG: hypothetical protein HWN70_07335 [Desulfobacterales bacterium]|nr:hypothetical protein [Desulfobacterales bacterium]
MKPEATQIACLVNMEDPQSVLEEVKTVVSIMIPDFDFEPLNRTFRDVVSLFHGQYPGYRKCNTAYHDLKHTTDALLAMARLIHGAMVNEQVFSEKDVDLGLISALLHDTGYIQTMDEDVGTGARFTLTHISRSILFMERYLSENGYSREDIESCRAILECTGLNVKIGEIDFGSAQIEMLGKMVGTADMLGQMADRTYLEKLPLLYHEFREGNVPGFESELDLLKETPGFHEMTIERFEHELGGVKRYMRDHFRVRWGIDEDLYMTSVENKIKYLNYVLENHEDDYREHLRRGNLMDKLDQIEKQRER